MLCFTGHSILFVHIIIILRVVLRDTKSLPLLDLLASSMALAYSTLREVSHFSRAGTLCRRIFSLSHYKIKFSTSTIYTAGRK